MSNPVILSTSGGSVVVLTGGSSGVISTGGIFTGPGSITPVYSVPPIQVAGFIPLSACNTGDCRDTKQKQCYLNPVFGTAGETTPSYENDFNSFLINCQSPGTTYQFVLYKNTNNYQTSPYTTGWSWVQKAVLNNNTYGQYYPLGSLYANPTYMGFAVNWGAVVAAFGAGIYMIQVNQCTSSYSSQAEAGVDGPRATAGKIQIAMNINWNSKTYTVPTFYISPGATTTQSINYICAQINALTSSSFPWTAVPDANGFSIDLYGIYGNTQAGAILNWRFVGYDLSGDILWSAGAQSPFSGGSASTQTCSCVLQSELFNLLPFDCNKARGTVKFESWNTGSIGDCNNDGVLFSLCNISWYDSIRMKGFFGNETYKFDEILLEYGKDNTHAFGLMDRVRDKKIPMYKLNGNLWPHWLHNRFSSYGCMADTLLISDYGLENPNYNLKRRNVIKAGTYEPKWLNKGRFQKDLRYIERSGYVTLDFVAGIQSQIKNYCCQTT